MSDVLHTETHGFYTLEIHHDHDPAQTLDDVFGDVHAWTWHPRWRIGEHISRPRSQEDYDDVVARVREACPTAVMVPMYMYEHGGFCLATKPFADPWDSGQVGIVWASDPGYTEETLCAIVEAASALAQGLVYGWVVKGPGGAHVDSCWGYIEPKGFDESSYVLQDAREHVSALIEEDTLHGWPAGQIHSLYTEHPVLNVAMMQKIQKNAL